MSALALIGFAWRAEAACDANGNPSPAGTFCYKLKGSDTLFDIVTQAINTARTNAVAGATDLFYAGTGSGNAEAAMKASNLAAGTAVSDLGVQSIGPMSRNMRPSIIDSTAAGFVQGGPGTGTSCSAPTGTGTATNDKGCGHAVWAAGVPNVVGLDAAVFLVKSTVALSDIAFTTFVDPAGPTTIKKGNINNTSLPTTFGNGGGFSNLNASCTLCGQTGQPACPAGCVNYNSVMSIVLSGVDASGTMAACSDPRRVQAIQDLAGLLGVTTISHVIRRDDNSGTTDTFKDRIMVVKSGNTENATYPNTGGRFCSGQAFGQINGAAAQQGLCSVTRATKCLTNASCPTGEVCQFNLNNQDFDPVRRPCLPASATAAPTSCTDWTTGQACLAGAVNCTQGLIVALSDTDPGATDITNSIGKRVGLSSGEIIGYAGREAANGTGAKGLSVNGIAPADDRVRDSSYLLARRLFIQNTFANSTATADIPTDGQNSLPGTTFVVNSVVGGGTDQRTKEQALWTSTLSNRTIMDPIVRQFGFIRCSGIADGNNPALESNNLCALTPAPAVTGPLGGYTPSGASGGGAGTAAALSIDNRGRLWNQQAVPPALVQATCAAGALCVSGGSCPAVAPLVCPDAAPLAANSPCTADADCSAGPPALICANVFGHSSPGAAYGLYCCDPTLGGLCHH